ncbi:MAG: RIP metalloprotease RseP [Candidatus Omnitrophica bacterium]|nr:RIP metalloprotease RseP [Candidatus Omnitrophota bacterium]
MSGVFTGIYQVLLTLAILGLLITLHEFGHFLMCRLSKIKVEKFSIGFGKEIWATERGGTRYAISIFPFGGYVRPQGEDIKSFEESKPKPGDYLAAPIFHRLGVVAAGPVMNWFLAWLLFAIVLIIGRPVQMATIGAFLEGYPAEASGLKMGDRVIAVDGKKIDSWMEMTELIRQHTEGNLILRVYRNGLETEVAIVPKSETDDANRGKPFSRIGIKPDLKDVKIERLPLLGAISESFLLVRDYTFLTYEAIFGLITRQLPLQTMSGPIGVVSMAAKASAMGIVYLIQLAAMLSVSLAVFNMLPIPALDGGHVLFLLIEAVKRKPLSLKVQERSTQVCFLLLIMLFVLITVNDIAHLEWFDRIKALLPTIAP